MNKRLITYPEYETDRPWLTNLRKEPQEIVNRFDDSAYRTTVIPLTRVLEEYGKRYGDPRVSHPKIAAEINEVLTSK